ncbi:MAG: hypothetical protein A4E44_01982 [Methanosaeta sp. PtaB.Bin018]|nr:MAG: hypothetical protein A4E44_01982 [Methanosaeta sp. PtaB.Bin018]OPY43585.1 MAG: hypothetical protein A4E46_01742 [Methanosaeta sp. PtaU1.Bin016]
MSTCLVILMNINLSTVRLISRQIHTSNAEYHNDRYVDKRG